MITFSGVSKQYGRQVLFVEGSFQIDPGQKVGLVGPNGAGKTTVFRMILGEETPDEGEITVPKRLSIGYYRQDIGEMSGRSVLDEAIAGSGDLGDLHHELMDLEHALADPARAGEMERLVERFGHVQDAYEQAGGYDLESRAREILHALGFDDGQVDGDVGALSGGWKMRVGLARILLGRPDVLLLDEPTNHLDIESILWLEKFVRDYRGTVVMTCHDKDFMNRIVDRILEIDAGEFTSYTGDYDFYVRQRDIAATNREAAYARQQAMLAKERRFIERFSAHAAKAAQVQSRVKKLEKIEMVELPRTRKVVDFEFRPPPRSGEDVLQMKGVRKAYGERVVYDGFDFTIRRTERWCVMGRNGAGKTTLLKMVAGDDRARRGHPEARRQPEGRLLRAAGARPARPGAVGVRADPAGLPARGPGRAAESARRVPVLGRRRRQADPRAVGRREVAPGARAHAVRSAQLPGPRRAHEPSRSRDQGDAGALTRGLRGHDAVREPRPHVPARTQQPGARAAPRRRRRAGRPSRRSPTSARTSSSSSAPEARRRACTGSGGRAPASGAELGSFTKHSQQEDPAGYEEAV